MKLNRSTALLAALTLFVLGACTTPEKRDDSQPVEASMSTSAESAPAHGWIESN